MNSIVNSADYPIHDLDSQVMLNLVASARSELTTFGACHFSQFLSTAGLSDCLKEAMSLESKAHPSNNEYTPYYRSQMTAIRRATHEIQRCNLLCVISHES